MAAGRLRYVIVGKTRMVLEDDLTEYARSLRGETFGRDQLLELLDDEGRIDVARIPGGTSLADLAAVKQAVAERRRKVADAAA